MSSQPSPNIIFEVKNSCKNEDHLDYVDEPQLVPIIKQEKEDDRPHSIKAQKLQDLKFVIADLPAKSGDDDSENKIFHMQGEDTKVKLESTNGIVCDEKFTIASEELNIKEDLTEHNVSQVTVSWGPNESKNVPVLKSNRRNFRSKTSDSRKNCRPRRFKCNQCSYVSVYRKYMNVHLQLHQNPETVKYFKCKICNFRTLYKGSLTLHLVMHGNPENNYSLGNHMLRHHDRHGVEHFQCKYCNFKTIQKYNFRKHLVQHKNHLEVETFECGVCDYKSIFRGNMTKHLMVHKKPHEIENFKCNVCDFTTIHKHNLVNHLVLHKSTDEIRKFICHQCNFQTIHKDTMRNHAQLHQNRKGIYTCSYCDYSTNGKHFFKKHVLRHKNKLDRYECEKCGLATISKAHLNKHLFYQHQCVAEDVYKCDMCEHWTFNKTSLVLHFRKHQNIEFKCEECSYRTTTKRELISHKLRHKIRKAKNDRKSKNSQNTLCPPDNPDMAAGALKCDRCNFQTTYEHCLKMHMLQHKYTQLIKQK